MDVSTATWDGEDLTFLDDWCGVEDPWIGVTPDLSALRNIVLEVFHLSDLECSQPVRLVHSGHFAQIYYFQLPTRQIVARLVAPVQPLFKTEAEVAAMEFARRKPP